MTKILRIIAVLLCVPAWAADCEPGEYAADDACIACPPDYPHSVPDATSVNDCYLRLNVGEYVRTPGAASAICPEGYYCPGDVSVFYNQMPRFQQIEYLESTGTQYIDTGIILGSDVDTEMVYKTGRVQGDQVLFGASSEFLPRKHYWLNGYNNNAYIRYDEYSDQGKYWGGLFFTSPKMLEVRGGDWIVDGKTIYSNSGVFTTDTTGYLFALHRPGGGNMWSHQSLKVYSFRQWRDGSLVLDLIPVYDSVRDECGMLDRVTGNFLGNVGTGKFECGAVVPADELVGSNGAASCAVATDDMAPYSPPGSDDVMDCGRVLRFSDDYNLYLRTVPRTEHSLKVQFGDQTFYGDSTEQECGHLRVLYRGQTLSVCNMDADI